MSPRRRAPMPADGCFQPCTGVARRKTVQRHRAAGAYEVWLGGRASIHLMAGSSLFPTGGAVNPTLTIYALTRRTVSDVLDNRDRLA